ncbi:MAG TPA: hypothetical protein VKZ50_04340 [bacterium]|nr:hypothetical protein [bacterium]
MPDSFGDPLRRRLAVVAASTSLAALTRVLPVCLRAARAAALAGWDVWTHPAPGLDELVAAEALAQGGTITVALPEDLPPSHWVRLLRVIYGRSIRLISCAEQMELAWDRMARVHYRGVLPAPLPLLAVPHAIVEGATLAMLMPPPSTPDPVIEHAAWLCRLLNVPAFDVTTVTGIVALHEALPKEE